MLHVCNVIQVSFVVITHEYISQTVSTMTDWLDMHACMQAIYINCVQLVL